MWSGPPAKLAAAVLVAGAGPAAAGEAEAAERDRMVARQIAARGVTDPRVLEALRQVERHLFVPEPLRAEAHADRALPLAHGQTISQPYVVGLMTELAALRPTDRVLEVGTGSGYQAAVLSVLVREVYTIEIVEPLALEARERLRRLGHANVFVRAGDGYRGWPEKAPFDAILVTAAPPEIPAPLLEQLAPGGRLVAPVGRERQELVVVTKGERGLTRRAVIPVVFVPMTGEAQERR
ncbi:MAG: protein-L-isoaspartate(D-aspartate) O-methyltransferase [Deltaproteobacteria bacterium]|nr:protein-L-isoaspartate(D-aspartate) O-methyltransferase [Deltaproteobacteria bacterium]